MAITEATKVGNVLLGHKFRMEFNGYAPAMIQECDIPERNFETVKYGGAGQTPEVKVAGGEVIGEFDLTVIVPVNGDERLFWQVWQDEVIAGDCTVYWRDATLIQLGPNDDADGHREPSVRGGAAYGPGPRQPVGRGHYASRAIELRGRVA